MTEAEWLDCADPDALLRLLHGRHSRRQAQLFACAWRRRLWAECCPHLMNPWWDETFALLERYADGAASDDEFLRAAGALIGGAQKHIIERMDFEGAAGNRDLGDLVIGYAQFDSFPRSTLIQRQNRALLRDIVGDPLRPLPRRRFPAHVVGLARACYEAFPAVSEHYPLLADALEDMGENAPAAHCREALHVKGCHVLDAILDKR
jgi:hypothetical protein